MQKHKIIRITTVPESLAILLNGQLEYMSSHFNMLAVTSSGDALLDLKKQNNIEVFEVNMTRKITPLKDLFALWRMYKLIKQQQPYIVHTHTPKAGLIGMLAAYLAKTPNRLHTVAGLPLMEAQGFKRKLLITVEKLIYSSATKVYPNSFGLKTFILENKLTKQSKIKVLGKGSSNGININHFNPNNFKASEKQELRKKLNILESEFVFVFVGRLVRDKGINELIKAFKALNKTQANIKLLLVGDYEKTLDPLEPDTEEEINTNKNIVAVGFKKDVRPYFLISNLLVFPSYREGFPNVVMQAGAMQLASIVSNINGCNEIITNEKNGFIISAKDTKALYNTMKFVLDNKAEVSKMGLDSRTNIVNNYSQKYIWAEILKEYKNL